MRLDRYRINRALRRLLRLPPLPSERVFVEPYRLDPVEAQARIGSDPSDLERLFVEHGGRAVYKWLHYLPIYERYLGQFRGSCFGLLEIGIAEGGSIELWRAYFGGEAIICGIDVVPERVANVSAPNMARLGSQSDPAFLSRTVAEMGRLDIVIDDGSHIASDQRASFQALFPLLAPGGIYLIEDLHTSYWPQYFQGGYRRKGTAIELAKQLVDDMHHWYHNRGVKTAVGGSVAAVHFHDSIVVIEKARETRAPAHAQMGEE